MKSDKYIIGGQYETYLDGDGRQIIDLTGGFGFQVPAVIDAVTRQAQIMGLSNRVLMSEPLIALCRRLAELLPEPLVSSYVCSSGDEAFEGALKLCKGLKPKGNTIVFIQGGEYGSLSYGRCLNATQGDPDVQHFLGFKRVAVRHLADLDLVEWSDCFAVCHSSTRVDANGRLQLLEPALVERLHAHAAQASVPVIAVDTQTCLGSLGSLFGFQRYRCVPDIVVLGGALGAVRFPSAPIPAASAWPGRSMDAAARPSMAAPRPVIRWPAWRPWPRWIMCRPTTRPANAWRTVSDWRRPCVVRRRGRGRLGRPATGR
ncbi:aminotransferase class III-fold pyridoxal phosphate-dependent enzyme [Pseudomonas corrugata]